VRLTHPIALPKRCFELGDLAALSLLRDSVSRVHFDPTGQIVGEILDSLLASLDDVQMKRFQCPGGDGFTFHRLLSSKACHFTLRKSRFNEEQILGFLKEVEAKRRIRCRRGHSTAQIEAIGRIPPGTHHPRCITKHD